ncbi:MAG: hypothetical protein JST16_03905 [Bdellovibrionales bacterium]|nr:hypothetical protein [Bdellovibrionales bacterium]
MTKNDLKLQASFHDFVTHQSWHSPHAVTLTMKQGRQADAGRGMSIQMLDSHEASANMRHFLNRLNQQVFGNAAQRFGKRVQVIPVLEGSASKNMHYHLILDCPRNDLTDNYADLISDLWRDTPWGNKEVNIQANSDAGWAKYISKLRDKPSFADAIDWSNCHVENCRD